MELQTEGKHYPTLAQQQQNVLVAAHCLGSADKTLYPASGFGQANGAFPPRALPPAAGFRDLHHVLNRGPERFLKEEEGEENIRPHLKRKEKGGYENANKRMEKVRGRMKRKEERNEEGK